ncbi:hypothetical protein [Subtercola sp. Z020]|nr:hypothetical protein [Subtercola sp. Z020]
MTDSNADPFHDFSLPQDADLVSSPTPNSEGDDDAELDDDPLGSDD